MKTKSTSQYDRPVHARWSSACECGEGSIRVFRFSTTLYNYTLVVSFPAICTVAGTHPEVSRGLERPVLLTGQTGDVDTSRDVDTLSQITDVLGGNNSQ